MVISRKVPAFFLKQLFSLCEIRQNTVFYYSEKLVIWENSLYLKCSTFLEKKRIEIVKVRRIFEIIISTKKNNLNHNIVT